MSPERADQILASIMEDVRRNRIELPTLPEVAIRVRRLLEDPRVTSGQVAKVITADAPLSARLLRVANSPLYRGTSAIENVRTAIARLGHRLVHNLVTSLVMVQLFQPKVSEGIQTRLRQVWTHSAHVAALCHVLAQKFTRLAPEEALLSGLIHDIGALPLLMYAETIPYLPADEVGLEDMLTSLHARVGGLILETWHFPPALVKATSGHEDLGREHEEDVDYLDIVIVANLLSYVGTQHRLIQMDWHRVPAFSRLGVTAEECRGIMQEAKEEVRQLQAVLTG